MKLALVLCLYITLFLHYCACKTVTISNTIPRRDINGNLMDCHDGSIMQWNHNDSLYYWYCMGYGNCKEPQYWSCSSGIVGIPDSMCGFQSNHSINLYTSTNLQNWTFNSNILPLNQRPFGIYFRPKVIYNEMTTKYVLWVNLVYYRESNRTADFNNATYVIATSSDPKGPFEIKNPKANVLYSHSAGDFVLFIDHKSENKTAYIAYDAFGNDHKITVEPLQWDYLDSIPQQNSGPISERYHEAPAMFERNGFYYLITGHCCCFCKEGSDTKVYVSNATAIGPYYEMNNNFNQKSDANPMNEFDVIINAQQNVIAQIYNSDGVIQYLWTGDRWKSAQDQLKSHDFQYWQLLVFDDSNSPPSIDKLQWMDNIKIDIA